jgi:hypothetical protein
MKTSKKLVATFLFTFGVSNIIIKHIITLYPNPNRSVYINTIITCERIDFLFLNSDNIESANDIPRSTFSFI